MPSHSQGPIDPIGQLPGYLERAASAPRESARTRGLAECRVIEAGDGEWRVYELDCGNYDRRAGPSLVFESDGVLRRVRDYPPNWRDLSDAELMEVSWRR
jgi:hypothetical protein